MAPPREYLLFVCDSLMQGEPEHEMLAGARPLGAAKTTAEYALVDLGASAALLLGGTTAVTGELYALSPAQLAPLDVKRGHPILHQRARVRLEGDAAPETEAYFIGVEQAPGRRRIRSGDWRSRPGAPGAALRVDPGALVRWAKRRHEPPR